MDIDKVREYIERSEGRRRKTYKDTMGHPTIGIGFNLDRDGAREKIGELGVDYERVRAGEVELTDEQINRLFLPDVDAAIDAARRAVSNFDQVSDRKQIVLVDMAFNLGAQGLRGFKRLIAAIEAEDWGAAGKEIEDSTWYGQVGRRAREAASIIREDP